MKLLEKLHPDIMCILQRKSGEILYDSEGGILVIDHISGFTMADATTEEDAKNIYAIALEKCKDVILRGACLFDAFTKKRMYTHGDAYQFVSFMGSMPIHSSSSSITLRPLDTTHINMVCKHYSFKELANKTYISRAIEEGMLGAFDDSELVGFIGQHDTGSIGLLEVFPAYRMQGIAQRLLCEMINNCKGQSKIAYGEIFETNVSSMNLINKLGFSVSGNNVYWFHKDC